MFFSYCPSVAVVPVLCKIQNRKLSLRELQCEFSESSFDCMIASSAAE